VLQSAKPVLAASMRDGSGDFAASTYALCEVLMRRHEQLEKEQLVSLQEKPDTKPALPPKLYTNRSGLHSLEMGDAGWRDLEKSDCTGFRGLTSDALVMGSCRPEAFEEGGFAIGRTDPDTKQRIYDVQDSDVLCFESGETDVEGCHMPIFVKATTGVFPPNTLFRLHRIDEPGTWPCPREGVYPKQRLLTVSAVFRTPDARRFVNDESTGKLCVKANVLRYAERTAYVQGLDDVLRKTPVLTMPLEFARAYEWTDWKGVTYNLRTEWAYVNGAAVPKPGCTPGTRDEHNGGMTPNDFLRRVNGIITERRGHGHGTMLSETFAYLTRDEALAVRLYSGPAYQPINDFLRQLSQLNSMYRAHVADHAEITFAATVKHIVWAVRKLSAVATPDEMETELWRAVRGEVPKSFWIPDESGEISAVDMGFMSTTRQRMTAVNYMDDGSSVLWRLKSAAETEAGFHHGADIRSLSQFADEDEVLFPPCTLLTLVEEAEEPGLSDSSVKSISSEVSEADREVSETSECLAKSGSKKSSGSEKKENSLTKVKTRGSMLSSSNGRSPHEDRLLTAVPTFI